jgi:hypothetical protein
MLGVAIAAMLMNYFAQMFPAPLKYMLEFNPGVPLRFTPGYKIGNTYGVVNTCHLKVPT